MPASLFGTPFNNLQPSLAVSRLMVASGAYPTGGADGDTLGLIYNFAGAFAPGTSFLAQGSLLSIAQNSALFSLLGTTYGGDGVTTFGLPNLAGTVTVGVGTGTGLQPQGLGGTSGTATVSLTAAQLPAPLPGAGGQSFDNMAPSLAITPIIAITGAYPDPSVTTGATFLGQVVDFAGTVAPPGWMIADGSLLPVNENPALAILLGTTFGGDGVSTFALPDLRGRVVVGSSGSHSFGSAFGQQATTLTDPQIPTGIIIDAPVSGQPVTNDQPSLALSYLVATSGVFPTHDAGSGFDPTAPVLGQIVAFAAGYAPKGWAVADGRLLAISQNQALFAVLGTLYGGNGTSTFALPDLRGRTLIGTGIANGTTYTAGQVVGNDLTTLSVANLPPADQTPVPCFLPGTGILTPAGERTVETLAIGDLVLTLAGQARPIVWIGTGKTLATSGRRGDATPVIVRKGAFGPNVPNRDLHVTKGHAFFLDNVLIPAEFLVNHRSILWDDRAQEVTVFHIELETHDVLVANGAAAESYRDDGNRWLFQNASQAWTMPPKPACAPVLTGGSVVDAVWRRCLDRAGPRPGLSLTDDPDLHVSVDGRLVQATVREADFAVFTLPETPRDVRLLSRATVPQEVGLARDSRCLGVAIQRIIVRQGGRFRTIEADDPRLADGFHAFETDNGVRWTDGDAALPASLLAGFKGAVEVVVYMAGNTRYWSDSGVRRAA